MLLSPTILNSEALPDFRHHDTQQAYWASRYRYNVVPAGRRSGKTAIAKRRLIRRALLGSSFLTPRYFAGAPTRDQAKRIFWTDLKLMIPRQFMRGLPSESELVIRLITGAEIHVLGMDKPERIEGPGWDGGILDEYGNMREEAWKNHVQPALADRLGWCDFIGVPEGRNHYYKLANKAKADMAEFGPASAWAQWHWESADILPAEVIAQAMSDLDELTFDQEYRASFVSFEGRAYYGFQQATHCAPLEYNPRAPLLVMLDFNVAPGVAAIGQEQPLPGQYVRNGSGGKEPVIGTGIIGEVHIPQNSNTLRVCSKILDDWRDHQGEIRVFGDATGGAGGSAKVMGSDWDLAEEGLRRGIDDIPGFGDRVVFDIPPANPNERPRLNAMNSRIKSTDGQIHFMIDPHKAPKTVEDFDGVQLIKGGVGEIDKKKDPALTHLSDGVGYYVVRKYPLKPRLGGVHELEGL